MSTNGDTPWKWTRATSPTGSGVIYRSAGHRVRCKSNEIDGVVAWTGDSGVIVTSGSIVQCCDTICCLCEVPREGDVMDSLVFDGLSSRRPPRGVHSRRSAPEVTGFELNATESTGPPDEEPIALVVALAGRTLRIGV